MTAASSTYRTMERTGGILEPDCLGSFGSSSWSCVSVESSVVLRSSLPFWRFLSCFLESLSSLTQVSPLLLDWFHDTPGLFGRPRGRRGYFS